MNTAAGAVDPPESIGDARAMMRRRTDHKILAAVTQLIRSGGLPAVTMEAVSAISGVAKTTLYRRYRDRFDLLNGVAAQLAPVAYPAAGLTPESLTELLRNLQDVFETHVGFAGIGHLFASDEAFVVAWREKIVKPRVDVVRDFFDRGVADGVLRPEIDCQLLGELVMGGMVMCDALRGDVPDDWAENVVQAIWPAIAARPHRGHHDDSA